MKETTYILRAITPTGYFDIGIATQVEEDNTIHITMQSLPLDSDWNGSMLLVPRDTSVSR